LKALKIIPYSKSPKNPFIQVGRKSANGRNPPPTTHSTTTHSTTQPREMALHHSSTGDVDFAALRNILQSKLLFLLLYQHTILSPYVFRFIYARVFTVQ